MSRESDRPLNVGETHESWETTPVKDRVSNLASKVKEKATEMGGTVGETMKRQRENAAERLDRVASTLHEKAGSVPGGQKASRVAHGIAGGMESTASYIREHDFKEMGDDLVQVCRRHPAKALLSALVAGFVLGRVARRQGRREP
jgi:ElaB/YqjD/DUF883 family membrane-anchored ribosome-binding protein